MGTVTVEVEREKTNAVIGEVEKLVMAPGVRRMLERNWNTNPRITIHRARLVTESYKETEGLPIVIRRAKAFEKTMKEMPIAIDPDQLIVGSLGTRHLEVILSPEMETPEYVTNIDSVATREFEPYEISDEDKRELKEKILPYWKNKSVNEIAFNAMDSETKRIFCKDPNNVSSPGAGILFYEMNLRKGPTHSIPHEDVVSIREGLNGVRKRAEEKLRKLRMEDKPKKEHFYEAVIICCDAAIAHARRYSELARKMAETADPVTSKRLRKIAEICEWVPANPPRTFHEAIQFYWFILCTAMLEVPSNADSFSRLDKHLYPFYKRDIEAGKLTDQEALELIENLWLHADAFIWWKDTARGSHTGGSRPLHIEIAGLTRDGRDATNKVSYLMVEATKQMRTQNPNFRILLHKNISEDFLRRACECAIASPTTTFWNADVIIQGLLDRGIPIEDARSFGGVGCHTPQIPGKEPGFFYLGRVNIGAVFSMVLHNGMWDGKRLGVDTGDAKNFSSLKEVLDAFSKQLEHALDAFYGVRNAALVTHQQYMPTPYTSAVLLEGCLERGLNLQEGGACYNSSEDFSIGGFADVADSLVAIKKFVFDEKKITMAKLIEACDKNFEGMEELRQMLINKAPKWGNDDDYADVVGVELFNTIASVGRKEKYDYTPLGEHNVKTRAFSGASYTANIPFGKACGAFPSGRKAGMPFAESLSPVHGCDTEGPTAVVKSAAKPDHAFARCTSILNLMFTKSAVSDVDKFASFVRTAFELGCSHIQFNVLSRKDLIDAQEHPEKYKTLIVRVSGYNARFVTLSKEVQDDIIGRTEHQIL